MRRMCIGTQGKVFTRAVVAGVVAFAVQGSPVIAAPGDEISKVQHANQSAAERQLADSQPAPGAAIVTTPLQRADLPAPGGPTVLLKSVTFEPPSAFLSDTDLEAITSAYVGRELDFSAISRLVRDVNDLYAKKGVVTAGAILPPQSVKDGVLTVKLVEGRQGIVTVVGDHQTHNELFFDAVRLTRNGDIVDVPTASHDIARFNKTHHAQLSLMLQPGAAFGLTDLALGVNEPPPNTIQFSVDNEGVKSTGEIQAGMTYQKYGLLGVDDQLLLFATATQGSLAGTLNFDTAISDVGTRLAFGATGSVIKVIAGPTEPLDISGRSLAATVTLTQALAVDADFAVLGLGSISYGMSQSFSGTTPLVDSRTTKLSVGVAASVSNETVSASVQPQLIYALADDRIFDTRRDLVIFAGSANADVTLSDVLHLESRGAWQYTREDLLPGNLLFQIGGPNTVRGYPSDGVGGDSGYFVQTELHWQGAESLPEGMDLYALTDFGQVFSTFPAITTMASIGGGLTYDWSNGASLDVSAAIPILSATSDQSPFAVYAKLSGTFH